MADEDNGGYRRQAQRQPTSDPKAGTPAVTLGRDRGGQERLDGLNGRHFGGSLLHMT
jgi:hypothetical protein